MKMDLDWLIKNGPKVTDGDKVEWQDVKTGQMTIFDYPAACPGMSRKSKTSQRTS